MDKRELPINLLHFGYIPTENKEKKEKGLLESAKFYATGAILKRLNQLEKEYGYDLEQDKNFVLSLENGKLPPAPQKARDTTWDKIVEMSEKNVKVSMKQMIQLVKAAGLQDYVENTSKLTFFFPIDDGFVKFGETLETMLENPKLAQTFVKSHMLSPEVITCNKLNMPLATKTVSGKKITLERQKEGIVVNGQVAIKSDILVSNGVIHVIQECL